MFQILKIMPAWSKYNTLLDIQRECVLNNFYLSTVIAFVKKNAFNHYTACLIQSKLWVGTFKRWRWKKQNKVQYHVFFNNFTDIFTSARVKTVLRKTPFVFMIFGLSLRFTMTTVWKILVFFLLILTFILLWFPIQLL